MVVAQEKVQWHEAPTHVTRTVKRSKPKTRYRWAARGIILFVLVVGSASTIAVMTIDLTVVKGAEVRVLEKNIDDLKAQNDLLQVDVDKLRSVNRIETAALAMGMEKPSGTVYVTGAVPPVNNNTGAPAQPAKPPTEQQKPSAVKKISQLFTGLFASTQR